MKIFILSIFILSLFINLLQPKHLLVEVANHENEENEDDEGFEEQIEDEAVDETLDISENLGGMVQDSIILLPLLITHI